MYRFILLVAALASFTTVASAAESTGPSVAPAGGPAPVGAPAGTAPAAQDGSSGFMMLIMMGGLFAIMYFLMIRPQQKQEKKRQAMIAAIKTGSKVVTIGGLHGEVVATGEQTVDLKVGENDKQSVVMTFNKSAIATNLSADPAGK